MGVSETPIFGVPVHTAVHKFLRAREVPALAVSIHRDPSSRGMGAAAVITFADQQDAVKAARYLHGQWAPGVPFAKVPLRARFMREKQAGGEQGG